MLFSLYFKAIYKHLIGLHFVCFSYLSLKITVPSTKNLLCLLTNSIKHDEDYGTLAIKEGDARGVTSDLESVLSLDDGRWSSPAEESWSLSANVAQESFSQLNIRQPSSPPVLAQVHPQLHPSKVADPRPGPAKLSTDRMPDSKEYQKLHIVSLDSYPFDL